VSAPDGGVLNFILQPGETLSLFNSLGSPIAGLDPKAELLAEIFRRTLSPQTVTISTELYSLLMRVIYYKVITALILMCGRENWALKVSERKTIETVKMGLSMFEVTTTC
jgi:hypothetical protein